jgi:hypothetical protein
MRLRGARLDGPTFGEVVWHMEPLHPVIGTHDP